MLHVKVFWLQFLLVSPQLLWVFCLYWDLIPTALSMPSFLPSWHGEFTVYPFHGL